MATRTVGVVAIYAARIDDLQFAPTITLRCLAFEHEQEVTVEVIAAKLLGWYRVLDIPRVVRCQQCGQKGRATIDARSALGHVG